MDELCENCECRQAEYDSPGRWCFNCWTEWWVDSMNIKNPKVREVELKKLRTEMKKKIMDR